MPTSKQCSLKTRCVVLSAGLKTGRLRTLGETGQDDAPGFFMRIALGRHACRSTSERSLSQAVSPAVPTMANARRRAHSGPGSTVGSVLVLRREGPSDVLVVLVIRRWGLTRPSPDENLIGTSAGLTVAPDERGAKWCKDQPFVSDAGSVRNHYE